MGYCLGDLKFQNICFDEVNNKYSLIDFGNANKIFHKKGEHKKQYNLAQFEGNSLFASDDMINLKSKGRKDDVESLIYMICFMYSGTLPVIEYIN